MSGVGPRVGAREAGGADVGPGDGMRDDTLVEAPTRELEAGAEPIFDSVELVLLCVEGKTIMLL